jgi:flagellar biosynthesis/type III secretory pathway M-ring protein FliF/YscJ
LFATRALKRILVPQRGGARGRAGYATYDAPMQLYDTEDEQQELDALDHQLEQEFAHEERASKVASVRQSKIDQKRASLRDGIVNNTKADPKTTSNLVRKWLRESE